MKQLFYGLMYLLGLSACSSGNIVLDSLKAYDAINSDCSLTLSETDTHSDVLTSN